MGCCLTLKNVIFTGKWPVKLVILINYLNCYLLRVIQYRYLAKLILCNARQVLPLEYIKVTINICRYINFICDYGFGGGGGAGNINLISNSYVLG